MKNYLKAYASKIESNWDKNLKIAEFSYNTQQNKTTKRALLEIVLG